MACTLDLALLYQKNIFIAIISLNMHLTKLYIEILRVPFKFIACIFQFFLYKILLDNFFRILFLILACFLGLLFKHNYPKKI